MAHSAQPDAVQRELIEETARLGQISVMQVAPRAGRVLDAHCASYRRVHGRRGGNLHRLFGARHRTRARHGRRLLCRDISTEWTAIARRAWRHVPASPTGDRTGHRNAARTSRGDELRSGVHRCRQGELPAVVILKRTRPGGIILVDNVLWSGAVVDPAAQDEDTRRSVRSTTRWRPTRAWIA